MRREIHEIIVYQHHGSGKGPYGKGQEPEPMGI